MVDSSVVLYIIEYNASLLFFCFQYRFTCRFVCKTKVYSAKVYELGDEMCCDAGLPMDV
jgi:hypothetical protein